MSAADGRHCPLEPKQPGIVKALNDRPTPATPEGLREAIERTTAFLDYATQYAGGVSLGAATLPEQNLRYADLRTLLAALRQRDEALTDLLAAEFPARLMTAGEEAIRDRLGAGKRADAFLKARATLTESETNAR